MRCAVRYYSRGGNTERVARAIAGELETDAYTTDTPLKEYADVLLVGSGMYAGHIDPHVKQFLEELDPKKTGKVAFFATSMTSGKKLDLEVREILDRKGIPMEEETFHCRGRFLIFHISRPNRMDLRAARQFADRYREE